LKKLAIIDMGSNSIRLVLVRIGRDGNYKIVHDLKESARLAKDFCPEQIIKPQQAGIAVKIMKMFSHLCASQHPDEIIVVATDAVRRALNREEFLERIRTESGFEVRVLTGREEAFFDYLGVVNSMQVENALLMDIGGGSTELVRVRDRQAEGMVSLPFGAINLAELYGLKYEELKSVLFKHWDGIDWLKSMEQPVLVGIGGSFRNIGRIDRRMKNYPLDLPHNYQMAGDDVKQIHNYISSKPEKQRKKAKRAFPGASRHYNRRYLHGPCISGVWPD